MSVKQLLLLCGCYAGEVATISCVGHCRLTQELAAEKLKSEQVKLDCQQQSARDLAEMEQQMTQAIQEAQASKALSLPVPLSLPPCLPEVLAHESRLLQKCWSIEMQHHMHLWPCAALCQASHATHFPTRPAV